MENETYIIRSEGGGAVLTSEGARHFEHLEAAVGALADGSYNDQPQLILDVIEAYES